MEDVPEWFYHGWDRYSSSTAIPRGVLEVRRLTAGSCSAASSQPLLPQKHGTGSQACSGGSGDKQGRAVIPSRQRRWAMDVGVAGTGTEISRVALTFMPNTELTSKSCSGGETWGSGGSPERVSKLLQAEKDSVFSSPLLLDDPGWKWQTKSTKKPQWHLKLYGLTRVPGKSTGPSPDTWNPKFG